MKRLVLVLAFVFIGCGNPNDSPPGTPAHCSQNFAHVTVLVGGGQQHIGCLTECPGIICWEVCEAIAFTRQDNHVICPCDGTPCEDIL